MYFGSAIQIRRGRRTGQAPSTTLALAPDRFDSGPPVRADQWLWRGRADRNVRGRPRLLVGRYNILTGFPGETRTDYRIGPKNTSSSCTHLRPPDGCEPICLERA
jgi:hypothetical protein